jgi:energy-coupling factor transporter ATP-binding protein EcfA2
MSTSPAFLRRVVLKNFKNIASCSVPLGPVNFIVGANGSGKSNFLDALAFSAESLTQSVDFALRKRGGIGAVRRRSFGHPASIGVRLDWELAGGVTGVYAFMLGSQLDGSVEVLRETCAVSSASPTEEPARFEVRSGKLAGAPCADLPELSRSELLLSAAPVGSPFRVVRDALGAMLVYRLNVAAMREWQNPSPGAVLMPGGENLASVLRVLSAAGGGRLEKVNQRIARLAAGVVGVRSAPQGMRETVEIQQAFGGGEHLAWFEIGHAAHGAVQMLGTLVAVSAGATEAGEGPKVLAIDDPDAGLHASAAASIRHELLEASSQRQVIATSRDAALLDDSRMPTDSLIASVCDDGMVTIFRADEEGRNIIRRELARSGSSSPPGDGQAAVATSGSQPDLFDGF